MCVCAGLNGTMTLNPDYLTSISHSTKRGQATVYTNRSPDYPDSGNGSANNSYNNSVNNSFNAASSGKFGGTDSLGSSLVNKSNNANRGGLHKGLRSPSQTAPARLGMWEDEHSQDRFLQVISGVAMLFRRCLTVTYSSTLTVIICVAS